MDELTLRHYDANATAIAERYERTNMSSLHRILTTHFPQGASILEIGCGSGRDAAFLQSSGFDVHGIDASAEMVRIAIDQHPELTGCLEQSVFPLPEGAETIIIRASFFCVILCLSRMKGSLFYIFYLFAHFFNFAFYISGKIMRLGKGISFCV